MEKIKQRAEKKTVFFDLFFTLVVPKYFACGNEYDILGIPREEWEKYAEEENLYEERALGKIKTEQEIVDKIAETYPVVLTEEQKKEILIRRQRRMKRALTFVDQEILDTLMELKEKGASLCLISNADLIDKKYWCFSPLSELFDRAVFSCDVGLLKPDVQIYELARRLMNAEPEECIFIGDGGSDELSGAKEAGMKTVLTEALERRPAEKRNNILQYADFSVNKFSELLSYL